MPRKHTYAISSDLTGAPCVATADIWKGLQRRHGLRAARAALRPHLTFVVGRTARSQELIARLSAIAEETAPFEVRLDGIGTFPGEQPVVFFKVRKDPALLAAYDHFLSAARSVDAALWPHYQPEAWVPHVTLALQDLSPQLLPTLLDELEAGPKRWTTRLESVSLVRVVLPRHQYLATLPFEA